MQKERMQYRTSSGEERDKSYQRYLSKPQHNFWKLDKTILLYPLLRQKATKDISPMRGGCEL